jgi:hypothetical protein
VYKGKAYSKRSLEEVLSDIDAMAEAARAVKERSFRLGLAGQVTSEVAHDLLRDPSTTASVRTMAVWLYHGGETIFLQDANALLARHEILVGVLGKLREAFPQATRITSYARSHTLARKPPTELAELRAAGLSRIHVGLETGHAPLLKLIQKGTTPAEQIEGGRRVRQAGIHLCFYVMPGLGGRALSAAHAADTARVVREVDPECVRLRSLVVHPRTPLAELVASGQLDPLDDEQTVEEIGRFLEGLDGCTGELVSDHDLNLLVELEGDLRTDRDRLLATVARFRSLPERERTLFIIGRRTHLMAGMDDLGDPVARARAAAVQGALESETGGDLGAAVQALRERMV